MTLTSHIGDTKTFSIPLRWGNRAFVPGDGWHLVFTAKSDPNADDDDAEIQLELGSGIAVDGSRAIIAITTGDTAALPPGTLFWDVQAESLTSDDTRTVASGSWRLLRDITRGRKTTPGDPETPDNSYLSPSGEFYVTPDGTQYYAQPA
jgi:hypothetical protein